jgi:hypothetical protein
VTIESFAQNSDSQGDSPVLGQEFAQQSRNNSVQLRLQLNNTGNVELKNLALGGNWRGGASTGTITSLAVGRTMNVDFSTPYQLMTPQVRTRCCGALQQHLNSGMGWCVPMCTLSAVAAEPHRYCAGSHQRRVTHGTAAAEQRSVLARCQTAGHLSGH